MIKEETVYSRDMPEQDSGGERQNRYGGSPRIRIQGSTRMERSRGRETVCKNGVYRISGQNHEGAAVVSVQCHIQTEEEQQVHQSVQEGIRELAAWAEENGGYIGHIKAAVKDEELCMYSYTDAVLMQKPSDRQEVEIHFAAIIFAVEMPVLRRKAEQIFRELCGGDDTAEKEQWRNKIQKEEKEKTSWENRQFMV